MELIIRRRAAYAIQEVFAHLEGDEPGLGFEFLHCVEAACAAIERSPLTHPKYHLDFHKYYLRRFPYALYYLIGDSSISLAVVFHSKRDPRELYALLEDELH